ncbi:MAG: type VI secretion system baseplate subunit TssF [Alphaproteobacteria bacterium]|nr:type VI secretion system baseplate subunit TssF [Alphaproteobacteria bacterium]
MDFLDYYRDNLGYLRTLGAEFAEEFPKIASRLSLSSFDCRDPYVERLLEGTAFLAARVEKKLDDGHKRLLESVLNSVVPDALYPIVSGAVVEANIDFENDKVRHGFPLPAYSIFDGFVPSVNTPCRFTSVWKTELSPLRIEAAEYITRDISRFNIDKTHAAALKITFEMVNNRPVTDLNISSLFLFLNLPDAVASLLLRQLQTETEQVYFSTDSQNFIALPDVRFVSPAVSAQTIYGNMRGNLNGLHVLQSFLSFPSFFKFVSLENIGDLFTEKTNKFDLLITFGRREPELVNEITAQTVKTNCVPVLNLFKKRSDRTFLDKDAYEFQIIADRTAPRDYEVYGVRRLEFFNERNETLFSASNFYDEDLEDAENDKRNFFSQHRTKSLFDRKATQRSSYTGTEVFVSLTERDKSLFDASQFSADLICTNRDLPLLLTEQTSLSCSEAAVLSASFVIMPSRPSYPLISTGGSSDWAKVAHIVFNLSGMLWQDGSVPLDMLRTLLSNYSIRSAEEKERMTEGIVALTSEPETFRFIRNGVVFFEPGWKVRCVLNEKSFAGTGVYIFALVLKELFKSFTPLNSLLEIEFSSQQSGHIATWKTLEN